MARIRTIKPDFFTSEDIVELEPIARLLYIALWCEADRDGRMSWKPRTFKMRYLPGDDCDIDALCDALVKRGLVCLYADGLAFIPSFGAHQHVNPREAKSVLPDPPGWVAENPSGPARGDIRSIVLERDGHQCVRCGSSDKLEIDHILPQSAGGPTVVENLRTLCKPCNGKRPVSGEALRKDLANDGYSFDELREKYRRVLTRADASNLDLTCREEGKGKEGKGRIDRRVEDASTTKPEKQSRAKPKVQIPDGYAFPISVREYGARRGFSQSELDHEQQKFIRYAKQNDKRWADWDMAAENWLDKAAEFSGKPPPVSPKEQAAAKEALSSMYYARADSDQLQAWDSHSMATRGKLMPRDKNFGWFVPEEWPPGYAPPEKPPAAPIIPRLQSMQGSP